MKVSRRWIEWAHGPGAEDGQPLAMSLCDLASAPGAGSIEVADVALIAELVDVAGLYVNPCRGRCTAGHGPVVDGSAAPGDFGGQGGTGARARPGNEQSANLCRCQNHRPSCNAMRSPMNPSNRDPAAIAAAFERADAIVALEGFVPDDNYRAIQRRVIAGELTSDQAVQLVIAQAQAADRALAADRCQGCVNPYVDPNTRVNFNRLGITDSRVLQVAEYQATAIRIQELDLAPIAGDFGLEHWRAVHKHIFQDVYDWAGKERTLNLSKVDPVETWWKSRFAPHDRIARAGGPDGRRDQGVEPAEGIEPGGLRRQHHEGLRYGQPHPPVSRG